MAQQASPRQTTRAAAHHSLGRFGANSAWMLCAAIAHTLLHAGTLAGDSHRIARGATLRRRIITVPARLTRPGMHINLHLPRRWPWLRHMATAMATGHRPRPTSHHLTLSERHPGPNNPNSGKAEQASSLSTITRQTRSHSLIFSYQDRLTTGLRIQAKTCEPVSERPVGA